MQVGEITNNPAKIVDIFGTQLTQLYTDPDTFNRSLADSIFLKILLPTIPQSLLTILENLINLSEVLMEVQILKTREKKGPDGFLAEYKKKKYVDLICPRLVAAFNSILAQIFFRSESLAAAISMIPKSASDDTNLACYRPISPEGSLMIRWSLYLADKQEIM